LIFQRFPPSLRDESPAGYHRDQVYEQDLLAKQKDRKLKIAIYMLITLCGVLPIAFQRIYWVRITSLAVLAGIAVFYGLGLQTSARLAGVREYQVTQNPPSEDWIDGAY
jgi:hypothetical protein